MSCAGMIIGMPGLEVTRVKSKLCIDVWARPIRRQVICKHCGGSHLRIRGTAMFFNDLIVCLELAPSRNHQHHALAAPD